MRDWRTISVKSDDWQYFIARNLSVWHNEAGFKYESLGLADFSLPALRLIKVCRGFHTDFYGQKRSMAAIRKNIAHQLRQDSYIPLLRTKYVKYCKKLELMSRNLTLRSEDLRQFFEFYGRAEAILDITQFAGPIATDWLFKAIPDVSIRTAAVQCFGNKNNTAPVQRLEKELAHVRRRRNIDIRQEADRLHRLYNWIPANFVSEPWDVGYFVNRLRTFTPKAVGNRALPPSVSRTARRVLGLLAGITSLNEYRKEVFTKVSVRIRPIFNRIANNTGLTDWREVSMLTVDEIVDAAAGNKGDYKKKIRERRQLFVMAAEPGRPAMVMVGAEAKKIARILATSAKNESIVSGLSAYPGKVIGNVKVIIEPTDFPKFRDGNILVAKNTSVDFVPIMHRAAAYVTDEGGLTCHAAVVAREYHKPCIVGTNIATHVLKDGDKVEVDATKGIVKKLK
ncbi:MAG: PEP-utilizing enzyme [Patescibacteria group bacterium]